MLRARRRNTIAVVTRRKDEGPQQQGLFGSLEPDPPKAPSVDPHEPSAELRELGAALRREAEHYAGANITLELEYMDDLSPDHIAHRITEVGQQCDSLGVVAAEHPVI